MLEKQTDRQTESQTTRRAEQRLGSRIVALWASPTTATLLYERLNAVQLTETKMSAHSMTASTARLPGLIRFVLVNDRAPGADTICTLCCEKIDKDYVRASQTRLLYCDARCFIGHEKMTTLVVKRRERQAS
jgi:hypothetical protein